MREVNLRIRAAAMRLDGLAAEIDWDFLCECGDPTCMEFVGLPMRDFEALVAVDGLVLARGHQATRRVAQLSCEPA